MLRTPPKMVQNRLFRIYAVWVVDSCDAKAEAVRRLHHNEGIVWGKQSYQDGGDHFKVSLRNIVNETFPTNGQHLVGNRCIIATSHSKSSICGKSIQSILPRWGRRLLQRSNRQEGYRSKASSWRLTTTESLHPTTGRQGVLVPTDDNSIQSRD
jgi:hypothetical protein